MGIEIVSVNVSKEKGTVKRPVPSITFNEHGIAGDAHAGSWHRQVSLLAKESIDQFAAAETDRTFSPGEFAENITTRGIDLTHVNLLDRFKIGAAELEVTQIGKKCHGDGCAIFMEVGKCVMPKEGLFCRVVNGGSAKAGDAMEHIPHTLDVRIITLSDRAYNGEYEDLSGPQIKTDLEAHFDGKPWNLECSVSLIPDDADALKAILGEAVAGGADIIFTTGGTGLGPRDITPDVVAPLLEKELPGVMEFIRVKYGDRIPSALLSRSVAGTIGQTQVYTLPGSVKAVKEYVFEILRTLEHAVFMIHGINAH
ncbi:Molybdopterin adenylyltransferase [Pontiella desulfatans]|uniref:Molybdopterin adenylyltransferase n=1 Tax=Pontiella desulfatans TaxID=2750659 RepID=A0A6C2U6K2_PONDE|nr:MOSC domain-containing protein [Pontiella desulfatans]VGO15479.1 Molybdopterin adenylyltransferase [Pontiella desulfatans]